MDPAGQLRGGPDPWTPPASYAAEGQGGVVGRLGFRVGISASYRYITSFGKLIHKLRHKSFGIVDLRASGPESFLHAQ